MPAPRDPSVVTPPASETLDPGSLAADLTPLPPAQRYFAVRLHAKGGLGEVHYAEDAELGRPVALKRIQGERADDPASRRRFLREAEVTARLQHPGIVPVYGLTADGDGRPAYAMRFVDGEPLDAAIDRFHQSPDFDGPAFRELLGHFVAVCNAVAYAHSRGVVHRDLKPANVMLGRFGETLVVDWGIAKTVEGVADAADTLRAAADIGGGPTQYGAAVGTPAYMSPEQAAGRHDALGPASDVYSLGATLYKMLTGRPPFAKEPWPALRERIGRGDYPPARGVNPSAPPGLAAVAAKAMAREPAARYASALDLARDVGRWLADDAVTAGREPAGVRLRRWVRKHARLVTGVAAALAVGAAALGGLAWQREQARAAVAAKEAETALERDVAREQKRRVRTALDDMVSEDMVERLGAQKQLTAGQKAFLQRALLYYKGFAAEAATGEEGRTLEADAHARVGYLLAALGELAEAEAAYRAALVVQEKLAADAPAAHGYRAGVGRNYDMLGVLLNRVGKSSQAEAAHRAALAVREKLAADHPDVLDYRRDLAQTHGNLGSLLAKQGRPAEALPALRAALAVQQKLAADFPDRPEYRNALALAHANLGSLHDHLGQPAEAETARRAALALREKLAADFPTVADYRTRLADSYNTLVALMMDRGKPQEAEAACRAALAVREKLAVEFPAVPDHRSRLADSYNTLSALLVGVGKWPEAEAAFRSSLTQYEALVAQYPSVFDYRHNLARGHSNLGALVAALGKSAEAEAAYRAALAVQTKLAADAPAILEYRDSLAGTHANLGALLAALGKSSEAEAAYRAALAVREKLVADHPSVPLYRTCLAQCHSNLAILLTGLGRRAEAEAAYRASLALCEGLAADFASTPDYAIDLGMSYCTIGAFVRGGGDASGAMEWHARAVARLAPLAAAEPQLLKAREAVGRAYRCRAEALTDLRRYADALADWDRALELEVGEARDISRLGRADCLAHLGRVSDATAAADDLVVAPAPTAATLYGCARVYALTSAALPSDAAAAKAIAALRRALAAGYRDVPHLLKDSDLAALRRRDDYAALLWDLADGLPR